MSGIETAIVKAGDRRTFALSLNPPVTVQAVGQWVKRGWVPPQRALEIEAKYGVDRAHLVKPTLVALVGEPA
jgi:hypothetical protein